ncbi:universal stress protein [Streptomyces sp. NPDC014733]|uniref:universal stress protein n=1 Tax=Streptomyces sp. NPDC014733 TaxID=3364885 RepID=UPI0036F90154
MEPVVTVGLDGSPAALSAAHWAAEEAERRGCPLRLLHAWPMLAPEPTQVPAEKEHNQPASRLVRTVRTELRADHPDLRVVGELVADDARSALLRATAESTVTVLGSQGLYPDESFFLGGVSAPVMARAEGPLVLVRAAASHGQGAPPAAAAPVVVALKLRGPCDSVLAFAFDAAAARGAPLRVVHGLSLPPPAPPRGTDHDPAEADARSARRRLDDVLYPWRKRYPHVEVAVCLGTEGRSTTVVRAAEGACLLVVGHRRHHLPRGPGAVVQAAVHHARCPVAVVPHG